MTQIFDNSFQEVFEMLTKLIKISNYLQVLQDCGRIQFKGRYMEEMKMVIGIRIKNVIQQCEFEMSEMITNLFRTHFLDFGLMDEATACKIRIKVLEVFGSHDSNDSEFISNQTERMFKGLL